MKSNTMGNKISDDFSNIKSLKNKPDEYFITGRKVKVINNEQYVKQIQSKYYGWDFLMTKCLNNVYEVKSMDPDKGIILRSEKKIEWIFDRAALEQVEEEEYQSCLDEDIRLSSITNEGILEQPMSLIFKPEIASFKVGEIVTCSSDESKFEKLQLLVGGYSKYKMKGILGKRVIVKYISSKYIKVIWSNEEFDIHPELLIKNIVESNSSNYTELLNHESSKNGELVNNESSKNEKLVNLESSINQVFDECNKLFEAIINENLDTFYKYIKPELINIKDNLGRTPLNYACCYGKLEIVKEMLDFGADLDIPDHKGLLPVHNCVQFNHEDILLLLFKTDEKSIEKLTVDGKTLLHLAVIKKQKNIIKILLEADINIYILDIYDKTAFQYINDSELNEFTEQIRPFKTNVTSNETNRIRTSENSSEAVIQIEDNSLATTVETIQNECEICTFRAKNVLFLNCGHTSCKECADKLVVCHMCNAIIVKVIKMYL